MSGIVRIGGDEFPARIAGTGPWHPYSRDCPCPDCLDAIGNQADDGPDPDPTPESEAKWRLIELADEARELSERAGPSRLEFLRLACHALEMVLAGRPA